MTTRLNISESDLHALLISEFSRLKAPQCGRCKVPLPYWGPSAGPGSGYWYMNSPRDCELECGQVIAELWAKVSAEYDIQRSPLLYGRGSPAPLGAAA